MASAQPIPNAPKETNNSAWQNVSNFVKGASMVPSVYGNLIGQVVSNEIGKASQNASNFVKGASMIPGVYGNLIKPALTNNWDSFPKLPEKSTWDFNKMRGEVDPTDMVPDPNSTPLNQAEMDAISKRIAAANAPVYKPPQLPDTFMKSEVPQDARAKAMALRQQISDIQNQMLRERHRRGLQYTDMPKVFAADADKPESQKDSQTLAMDRIDALRQELGYYERAGQQDKFRVRTPQSNFEMQRDLAKQASDIMAKDVEDMTKQLATMPEGPAKDAQAEKLRALKYQQQEQFRKANVMDTEDVGPPAPGVQPGDYQAAMQKAGEATARQEEAGPRLMKQASDLAAINYAEGEKIQGSRLDQEQKIKDYRKAQYEAAMNEITAPERIRALGLQKGQTEIESMKNAERRSDEKLKADIAEANAVTAGRIAQNEGVSIENQMKQFELETNKARKPIQDEIDKINLDVLKMKAEAQKSLGGLTPEMTAQKDAMIKKGMDTAGVTEEKFTRTMDAFNKLKEFMGGWDGKTLTGTFWTQDPGGSKQIAAQLEDMALSMKDASKLDKDFIKTKARELLTGAPEVTGYGTTAAGTIRNILTIVPTSGLLVAAQTLNSPELKATFLRIQNAMNIFKELAGEVPEGQAPKGR